MRDLMTYAKICMQELDAIGIKYGKILRWEVNTRAKSRWGQCRTIPGGYSININSVLLDDRNDEKGLKETIHHELLHNCGKIYTRAKASKLITHTDRYRCGCCCGKLKRVL